jgi:hypothetical protein
MSVRNNINITYFKSPVSLRDPSISNLTFHTALESSGVDPKYIHAAWYDNNQKGIFLSSSIDRITFTVPPRKIMDVEGTIKDIKIIAKDDDFVITAIEEKGGESFIRAATGVLTKQGSYDFKPCEKAQVDGSLINVYTAWTKSDKQDNSTDYFYFIPNCPEGQHFDINTQKCVPNEQGQDDDGIGAGSGSHCTRLSVLNKQRL